MAGVAIVTGANRGIGFHIAKQLVESKRYAEVVIGCRDPVAGEQAANDIATATGAMKPVILQLDLNDDSSVETFASTIAERYPRSVRCHVNNAGFAFKSADPTPFEGQTAPTLRPNFYMTVKLSELMIPLLEAAEPAGCGRLVNVASMAGKLSQLQPHLAAQFSDPAVTLDALRGLVDKFQTCVHNGTHKAEGYCDTDMTSHKGPRPPGEGAKNAVILTELADDGATGQFFQNLTESMCDLVHDVAYDYYGQRVATVSSDRTLKIWDLAQDGSQAWQQTGEITPSDEVKDHQGSIWRVDWAHPQFGQVLATCADGSTAKFVRVHDLPDSRESVTGVKFSPKHHGLKLATCAKDGTVRIYEALDVMNLANWSLLENFKAKGKSECTSISWNPSKDKGHGLMLAVGTKPVGEVVQSSVGIWELQDTRRWSLVTEKFSEITEAVHDVAFAPNFGRSYHLLAVAAESKVYILKMTAATVAEGGDPEPVTSGVWRVAWNVTGTVLASAGHGPKVRLWKTDYKGDWKGHWLS
eukprot:gene1492-29606_t